MQPRVETATWSDSRRARVAGRGCAASRASELGRRLGPYELLALLGEGGMARVWLAEHTLMGRQVAIKQLAPSLACFPEAHRRFLREARIAAAIRHPSVIEVFDFGSDDGLPYFAMELVAGETLARRLVRGPLLMSQCFDAAIVLAEAVAAVHEAGYLHRDLKSENVMLMRDGRRLVPKLIDFGIARRIELEPDDPDARPAVVGTLATMAPEQITLDDIDQRTDLWALGVLFYEMATARLPFAGGATPRDEMLTIVTEPAAPLPPHVDPRLRAVIEACLHKDPADRPVSADAVAEALRVAQAGYLARRGFVERL